MKSLTARLRARRKLILALIPLVALALAFLSFVALKATSSATTGQGAEMPTVAAAGVHADMDMDMDMGESSSHDSMEGHGEQMTGDHSQAATGHADGPEGESAAHGHGAEVLTAASSTRGLVLAGFGAVNGLVIAAAAISKTKIVSKPKVRHVSRPDTTTSGGVS